MTAPASPRVENGHLDRRRAEGKLRNLETRLHEQPLQGHTGIGHTRWATHGRPTERNAHPHMNAKVCGRAQRHHRELPRAESRTHRKGHVFETDTDTEAVVHLVTDELRPGPGADRRHESRARPLQGAFALGIIFAGHDDLMIAARQGSPLAIGHGTGEMYLGSDAIALAPFTDTITYLEEGDWAVLHRAGVEIFDRTRQARRAPADQVGRQLAAGRQGQPPPLHGEGNPRAARGHQPHAGQLHRHGAPARSPFPTSASISPPSRASPSRPAAPPTTPASSASTGSSATRAFPSRSTSPPSSATASRRCVEGGLAVFVSQSGETADTLATLRYCKAQGQRIASIVNVRTSIDRPRESDAVLPTLAGPEIGVASTKAFTCQLSVLACLAIALGRARGTITAEKEARAGPGADRGAAPHLDDPAQRTAVRGPRAHLSKARDVLYPRPRHQLSRSRWRAR